MSRFLAPSVRVELDGMGLDYCTCSLFPQGFDPRQAKRWKTEQELFDVFARAWNRHKNGVPVVTDAHGVIVGKWAMSFMTEALDQLRWINSQIDEADESERRALESARKELMELMLAACDFTERSFPKP